MRRKFIHIFTLTLLSLSLIGVQSYAQEGEELPVVKQEEPVLEKDSVTTEEEVVEEPKGDMLTPILITPRNRNLLVPEGEQNNPKREKPSNTPVNGDKAKESENAPNLRFNLLYYLFYKVKVGSTSGSSN